MRAADLRVAALAAFSHEIRTPLTALRMISDLAAPAQDGARILDAELGQLLEEALGELQGLVDALQEQSRAERGLLPPTTTQATLQELLDVAAAETTSRQISLLAEKPVVRTLQGLWDLQRLGGAIGALCDGLNRLGVHSSEVQCAITAQPASCRLLLTVPGRGEDFTDSLIAAPFAFFAAISVIEAAGGHVEIDLTPARCSCSVTLPAVTTTLRH